MTIPLLFETHSHTPLCKHAVGTTDEYAQAAIDANLRGLTVTCHNPMPDGFSANVRMELEQFDEYVNMVESAAQRWAGSPEIHLGIEADYFEGYESFVEKQLKSADFSYVIGSVHPQIREFKTKYDNGDPRDLQTIYFEKLADAAETKLFDCISHPDLIKNSNPEQWHHEEIMVVICESLDRIAKTGVAMELNTSGANKVIAEMNPFPNMLVEMRKRSIPVVIGADAHQPARVGDRFAEALSLLQECGYEEVSIYSNRQRMELRIEWALESLQKENVEV